ncbi:hypothetical protein Taro_026622 [Colocasia esculenta]|uniref:Uncharacterized protein n=1 Tax=Colocasia esculenta TaxID=4460 RepID=A0A843VK36_COLES|nr:hypothetical protein [Colocasia esculenta]
MGLQLCVYRCGVGWSPQLFDLFSWRAVGPFVRDCEAERLFLCCVVRVGYWPDQLVVCSRVVASFFATRALLAPVVEIDFKRYEQNNMKRAGNSKMILTRLGYRSVLVFSSLDINSGLASRWVTSTVCWRQWCAVNMVLASIDVDVNFFNLASSDVDA